MNGNDAFNPRMVFWVVLANIMAAAAFFVVSTYAPDFRLAGAGGGTPLSKSGVGFAGLVELLTLSGEEPSMARSDADLEKAALLIVPLPDGVSEQELDKLIKRRDSKATLFILPKWVVAPRPDHPGWDSKVRHLAAADLDRSLRMIADCRADWSNDKSATLVVEGGPVAAPAELQWIADKEPLIATAPGQALITQIDGQPHYVLSDPDMLDNLGLADPGRAAAALRMIRKLKPNADPVMFDLTLLGAGRSRSLEKLLIEPPFLAMTLSLLVAGLLALGHGFVRFGPPAAEARAIAFGKYALADTTARLFRRAGRLGTLGGRYATLMRLRAGAIYGAPPGLPPEDLDAWLDALPAKDGKRFSELTAAVDRASSEAELHATALALHEWFERRRRDR